MGSVSDIRNGLIIKFEGDIYEVQDFLHVNPGKGQAFVRTTLKHLETGNTRKQTFKKGDNFETIRLAERKAQYLYSEHNKLYFMDLENYEQYILDESTMDNALNYLKENMEVTIKISENNPIDIELPNFVSLEVKKTEPGVRGNTSQGGTKPATLETGLKVKVPLFIEEGDEIVVDTRTGEYSERK